MPTSWGYAGSVGVSDRLRASVLGPRAHVSIDSGGVHCGWPRCGGPSPARRTAHVGIAVRHAVQLHRTRTARADFLVSYRITAEGNDGANEVADTQDTARRLQRAYQRWGRCRRAAESARTAAPATSALPCDGRQQPSRRCRSSGRRGAGVEPRAQSVANSFVRTFRRTIRQQAARQQALPRDDDRLAAHRPIATGDRGRGVGDPAARPAGQHGPPHRLV